MTPDGELLRQYAEKGAGTAFAELVRRHIDLVYSVALREANGDAPLAEDATQSVFIDLARKARALAGRDTLAGWLHTSARFAASKAIRGEQRRRAREQESLAMNETLAAPAVPWDQLRPLLDECVGQLKEADRDAIVLRFFQGKTHQEVGAILGLTENSANKRIERALEKLRSHFASRGVTATSALLATTITANSIQAAPLGLTAHVTAASLAGAGAPLAGSALLALLGGLIMNTKTKIAAAAVFLVLLALSVSVMLWPEADSPAISVAPAPAPAQAPAPPLPAAPAEAVAPVAPPVPVAYTASVAAPVAPAPAVLPAANDPRLEINSAMDDFVGLLQSGNFAVAVETYMQIPATITGQQLVEALQKNPDFPNTVQMMIDATTAARTSAPTYDDTGDLATYLLATPTDGKTMVRWKRINGKWFVDAFE